MELGLKGKTAIITNADNDLGKAIAYELAQEGVNIALCFREKNTSNFSDKFLENISCLNINRENFFLDETDRLNIINTVNNIREKFGNIDILINNITGITLFNTFLDTDEHEGLSILKNYLSFICSFIKNTIPYLKESTCPRIINISSLSGKEPGNNLVYYNIYNSAIMNLTKTLSRELAIYKISVNNVCIGAVKGNIWNEFSEFLSDNTGMSSEDILNIYSSNSIPLGRFAVPEEISPLIAFLSSKKADYITGASISIDGGASYST